MGKTLLRQRKSAAITTFVPRVPKLVDPTDGSEVIENLFLFLSSWYAEGSSLFVGQDIPNFNLTFAD